MNNFDPIVTFLETQLQAYLDDLRTLVAIDSGIRYRAGVEAVNLWLEKRLSRLGFQVERPLQTEVGDALLARRTGSGPGRVLLLGHSDTVFPVGTAASRPMSIERNIILGPGTCDMKAGLLSGLYALEALQATGFTDFDQILYLTVPDEESQPRYAIPLIRSTARRADVVLTLEAARANGDIVTARKTNRWYTLELFGRAAHAGVEPEKGRSAILALAHLMVALDRLNRLRPGVTVNLGVIEGGTLPNVVADYAKVQLDLRAFTEADMQHLLAAIDEVLTQVSVPDVRIRKIEEEGHTPAMERTPAVIQLEQLVQQLAQELGFTVKGASTGGVADGSFAAAEGVPVLDGLGPVGGLDHSPNEYIELNTIVPRTALLAKLIAAICRNPQFLKNSVSEARL
jgi:glutamate carboxypeptidase